MGFLLGIVAIVTLLNMNIVQTYIGTVASRYFSKQWEAEIQIYAINFNLFSSLTLKGVRVVDPQGELVLDAQLIRCTYKGFPIKKGLKVKNVHLKNTEFHLKSLENGSNLSFITDYFKSDEPKDTVKKDFPINVGRLELENVTFSLENRRKLSEEVPPDKVNPKDMYFTDIYSVMEDIQVIRDSIKTNIKHLRTNEKSGLIVKNLQMEAAVSPHEIAVKKAAIETENSKLIFNASLQYDGWPSMKDYVQNVYMDVEFEPGTYGNMNDAYYWSRGITPSKVFAHFSGSFKGTINDFETQSFNILVGDNTSIAINSKVVGLPKIQETVFDADIELMSIAIKELNSLKFPEKWNIPSVPTQISEQGCVMFSAKVKGGINDFKATADLQTNLGDVNVQLALNLDRETETHKYIASVNTSLLNLEPIFRTDWLQKGELSAQIVGEDLNFEKMKADIRADIKNLEVKNYTYDSISISGFIDRKQFDGKLNLDDENITLDFHGIVGMREELFCDAEIKIENAKLIPLNLSTTKGPVSEVSVRIKTDFSGSNIDNLAGYASIHDIALKQQNKRIMEDSICVSLRKNGEEKELSLLSNFLDFRVNGDFSFKDINQIARRFSHDYIPQYAATFYNPSQDVVNSTFKFEGTIKDFSKLSTLFVEELTISENTTIQGNYSEENSLDFSLKSEGIQYGKFKIDQPELSTRKIDSEHYGISFRSSFAYMNDMVLMRNIVLNAQSNHSKVDMDLWWDDKTDSLSKGEIHAQAVVSPQNIELKFLNSEMLVQGALWKINKRHDIRYKDGVFLINNLVVSGKDQEIELNAEMINESENEMVIGLKNFELGHLNFFTRNRNILLGGAATGDFSFNRHENRSYFKVNLDAENLSINDEKLGNITTTAATSSLLVK